MHASSSRAATTTATVGEVRVGARPGAGAGARAVRHASPATNAQ